MQPVLIAGQWRPSTAKGHFQSEDPATLAALPDCYPISTWADCEAALEAAQRACRSLETLPVSRLARFLEGYASRLEANAQQIVEMAHRETALPVAPRLRDVELPRTVNQLRQAAAAADEGSWRLPTIDTKANIRSLYAAIGPVAVFGPNNFPLAFNSISGGDFAAAIAAGNPVIAKANTSHPGTTRLLALVAQAAAEEADLPPGCVQLIYRLDHADGRRLVADPRLGATAYTGSRPAGLELKAAADAAGKPIYLELSSINPVIVLPGAIDQRATEIADQFTASCLMGSGQFCTNPGLVLLIAGTGTSRFIDLVKERFDRAGVATLLSRRVEQTLAESIEKLCASGAELIAGGKRGGGQGASFANTLLRTTGRQFLAQFERLQIEAFGNASLFVVAQDVDEAVQVVERIEGNLTGTIYSSHAEDDEVLYRRLEPPLRRRVGRLLNDKMPTGVAVSPAMNHGGPYPATGHPGFTAVGIPAALRRFAALHCYDNVRQDRLPPPLADVNPNGRMWRFIDGAWTRENVVA